jgi:hypothetical protein
VFLADAQCKFDAHQEELPELRQLQQEYRHRLKQRPHKRESFRTLDDLRYKIQWSAKKLEFGILTYESVR